MWGVGEAGKGKKGRREVGRWWGLGARRGGGKILVKSRSNRDKRRVNTRGCASRCPENAP